VDGLTEADAAPFRDSSAIGGEALRLAREARQLSIVDVARQIHLSTSQVRDLELGRAESFHNAEVRRRLGGRYCDFLDLPRSLVADSPRPDFQLQMPGNPVRARPVGSRHGGIPWRLVGVLIVLGAVLVQAGWQWWGAQAWDLAFAPVAVAPPVAPLAIARPVLASPAPAPEPPAADDPPAVPPAATPTPPPTAAAVPVPVQAVSRGRLRLTAHGDRCWVEVQHDRGRIARVLQPGESIDLPEEGLHKVFIGNVRAMTATLNGQPLDLRSTGGVTARYDAP
jgi:hypothetical protein